MKHEKEIIHWAKSPEGTKVWVKPLSGEWFKINNVSWDKDITYIVDDEYAELRKAQADGKTIEYKPIKGEWEYLEYPEWNKAPQTYRIKTDEPTYYYQWEKLYPEGRIITSEYLTDETADYDGYKVSEGWRRIESSKRTWED